METTGGVGPEFVTKQGVSQDFESEMKSYYSRFEPEYRNAMREAGVKVEMYPGKATDHFPELRNVTPRGWAQGASFDNLEGFWDSKKGRIAMFEARCLEVDQARREYVLYHEVGHALDDIYGGLSKTHVPFWDQVASQWGEINPYLKHSEESFAHAVGLLKRDGTITAAEWKTPLPKAAEVEEWFSTWMGPTFATR